MTCKVAQDHSRWHKLTGHRLYITLYQCSVVTVCLYYTLSEIFTAIVTIAVHCFIFEFFLFDVYLMIELYLDYVRQAMEDNQAPEDQEGQDHAIQDQVRQALQDNQVLDLGVTSIGSSDPRDPKTS